MPIIDPGITVVDGLGRPLLSKDAIHLGNPPSFMDHPSVSGVSGAVAPGAPGTPNFSQILPPNSPQTLPGNTQTLPGNTQTLPSNTQTLPGPPQVMQGLPPIAPTPQSNLPKFSIPSDRYKETEGQMPQRDDPKFQQHGLSKLGNIIASLSGGPFAPIVYNALKDVPYRKATDDWQTKLAAIKPEVDTELSQGRDRRESEQFATSQASTEKNRQSIEADRKQREAMEQTRLEDTENKTIAQQKEQDKKDLAAKKKADLDEQFKTAKEKRDAEKDKRQEEIDARRTKNDDRRLGMEEKRLNMEANRANKGEPGTWQPAEDENGKPVLFNSKTGETRESNVRKYGTQAKLDAKTTPLKAATEYANTYQKSGKYTGPGDEALMEQFFEMAKPSAGFRMTQPQMKMLMDSRSWKSGAAAYARHATTGTWFDDTTRQNVVKTINDLAAAKGVSPTTAGGVASGTSGKPGKDDVVIHWPGEK